MNSFYFCKNEVLTIKSRDELSIRRETVELKDGRKLERYFCLTLDGKKVIQFADSMSVRIEEMIAKGTV